MSQKPLTFGAYSAPTQEIVNKTAWAMQDLSRAISELEDGLLSTNMSGFSPTINQVNHLQNLDLIAQMAEEISLLLLRLADKIPCTDNIETLEITSQIQLERLRAIFDSTQKANLDQFPSITLF